MGAFARAAGYIFKRSRFFNVLVNSRAISQSPVLCGVRGVVKTFIRNCYSYFLLRENLTNKKRKNIITVFLMY
jgi:hypothetical protein